MSEQASWARKKPKGVGGKILAGLDFPAAWGAFSRALADGGPVLAACAEVAEDLVARRFEDSWAADDCFTKAQADEGRRAQARLAKMLAASPTGVAAFRRAARAASKDERFEFLEGLLELVVDSESPASLAAWARVGLFDASADYDVLLARVADAEWICESPAMLRHVVPSEWPGAPSAADWKAMKGRPSLALAVIAAAGPRAFKKATPSDLLNVDQVDPSGHAILMGILAERGFVKPRDVEDFLRGPDARGQPETVAILEAWTLRSAKAAPGKAPKARPRL